MSQCPMCFSAMRGDECPTCGYSGEASTLEIPTVKGTPPDGAEADEAAAVPEADAAAGAGAAPAASGPVPSPEQALVLRAMARSWGCNLVGAERFGVANAGELEVPLGSVRELEKAGWIAPAGRLQGATGWRLTRAGQPWAVSRAQLHMLQDLAGGKVFLDRASVAGGYFDGEPNRRYSFHEVGLALAFAWIEPVAGSLERDDAGRVRQRQLQITDLGREVLAANGAGHAD